MAMTPILAVQFVVLVVLFLCSAFFSSAETALFSLDPIRIQRIRRTRAHCAESIERLLATPTKLLSTILIGNTLVNAGLASIGYAVIARLVHRYDELIAIWIMTLLILVFGEVTPKRLAIRYAEPIAKLYAPVVLPVLIWLLSPFRFVVEGMSSIFEEHLRHRGKRLTEDEFLMAVRIGEQEGALAGQERRMVDGVVQLAGMQASDVMTPRVDLVGIDLDEPPSTYEAAVRDGSTRYAPVYRRNLDRIEGLLDAHKFLLDPERRLQQATLPPLYVPESVTLTALLGMLRHAHTQVAVVVDEYGGTAGMITQDAIMEEILSYSIGEDWDRKPPILDAGKGRWVIHGTTSLEEINYSLGLELEAEGVDRISGWLNVMAGRIPEPGQSVTAQGCKVTVNRARGKRVSLVVLEKTTAEDNSR